MCLLLVEYFLKLFLFPCIRSAIFSHTPVSTAAFNMVDLLSRSPLPNMAQGSAWTGGRTLSLSGRTWNHKEIGFFPT